MAIKLNKNICELNKKDKKLKEGYLGQTLQDFLDVCIDEYVIDKIYVYGTEDIVYEGPMDDLPDDMRDAEFLEFEAYSNGRDMVTINVDSTEEYGLDTYYTTLEDFLDDCNNENIIIFDLGSEEEIFRGDKYDIPDELKDLIFASFDSPNELSVNLSDYEGDSDDYDEDEDDDDFDESLKENEQPFYRVIKNPKGKGYCILKRVNKNDEANTFINDHSKEVFNTPEEAKAMLDKVDELHFYIDENLKETKVNEAVSAEGLKTLLKDYKDGKFELDSLYIDSDGWVATDYKYYDIEDDEPLKESVNYNELLKDAYKLLDDANLRFDVEGTTFEFNDDDDAENAWKVLAKKYGKNKVTKKGLFKVKVDLDENLKESKELPTIETMFKQVGVGKVFDRDGYFTDEALGKYDIVADKFFNGNIDRLDALCDEEKCFKEGLKESTIPVKDLLIKVDNKYGITLDHAIDDIKKKKRNPYDSLLGDEGAISTLMKRFGIEKRDVIRALNYKFDGKVLDESVEDDMEKLPHVVMAYKDGGKYILELQWRPTTRKTHSDYVDLTQALKKKFGDVNIKVQKQDWRDGNKETHYVLEVELKDKEIKEDISPLAKKLGAKLMPPKGYGVKKRKPRYVYEVYYFTTEDCRGDAIYRKFSSRKAQEQWYEAHKDDPDKFGMYAFDDATIYEGLNETYNTEDRIKELKEIKKTRALTDDELEELAYCENEVSSRDAEQRYLNGESLDEEVHQDWDDVEFTYNKLPIVKLNPDTLDHTPMEIDFTHKVTREDVEDALFNILENKGELDDYNLEDGIAYVMNNFDELVNKYEEELKSMFISGAIHSAENEGLDETLEETDTLEEEDSLDEDTVKKDGKWVNKGNTGKTHGEFKTKKEADAQRKAMFAGRKPNAKWGK